MGDRIECDLEDRMMAGDYRFIKHLYPDLERRTDILGECSSSRLNASRGDDYDTHDSSSDSGGSSDSESIQWYECDQYHSPEFERRQRADMLGEYPSWKEKFCTPPKLRPSARNRKDADRAKILRIQNNDPSLKSLVIGDVFSSSNNCKLDSETETLGQIFHSTNSTRLANAFGVNTCLERVTFTDTSWWDDELLSGLRNNTSIHELKMVGTCLSLGPWRDLFNSFEQSFVRINGINRRMKKRLRRGNKNPQREANKHSTRKGNDHVANFSSNESVLALGSPYRPTITRPFPLIALSNISLVDCDMNGMSEGIDILTSALDKCECIQAVSIEGCNIGPVAFEKFIGAIGRRHELKKLDLRKICIEGDGFLSIANLLQDPQCSIDTLDLRRVRGLDDNCAITLANAIKKNAKLESLLISIYGPLTDVCWNAFCDALCDTSSLNETYFSNHTIRTIADPAPPNARLAGMLRLIGKCADKKEVAIRKIIHYHSHFDMEPFFEWNLKMMPLVLNWFDQARACSEGVEAQHVDWRRLNAIYQFIHTKPEVLESDSLLCLRTA